MVPPSNLMGIIVSNYIYPLAMTNIAIENDIKWPVEIVDKSPLKMVMFHTYVNLPEDKWSYDLDDAIFIFDRIKLSSGERRERLGARGMSIFSHWNGIVNGTANGEAEVDWRVTQSGVFFFGSAEYRQVIGSEWFLPTVNSWGNNARKSAPFRGWDIERGGDCQQKVINQRWS
jgi:hypothetical protein